jgi:23S rRNA (cytosine1962-C5)-methyltransferase
VVRENGLSFDLDLENSQKTGFFLDQKYNRRAVRQIARGRRVLDCFCHVGPFGLNAAAGGADFVRGVDVSATALDLARENARLDGLDARMDFTCADVLEYLPELVGDRRRLRAEGGPFDLIVLDPPAFTKSRGTVEHAARGYRQINYDALRLLPRGGYLATCSCSHFMTRDLLTKAISQAAHDANVQLKQVEERQQAPDHPILWGMPETHYLDFFVFQVV